LNGKNGKGWGGGQNEVVQLSTTRPTLFKRQALKKGLKVRTESAINEPLKTQREWKGTKTRTGQILLSGTELKKGGHLAQGGAQGPTQGFLRKPSEWRRKVIEKLLREPEPGKGRELLKRRGKLGSSLVTD